MEQLSSEHAALLVELCSGVSRPQRRKRKAVASPVSGKASSAQPPQTSSAEGWFDSVPLGVTKVDCGDSTREKARLIAEIKSVVYRRSLALAKDAFYDEFLDKANLMKLREIRERIEIFNTNDHKVTRQRNG